MGWVPKKSELAARIKELADNYTASEMTKMQILYGGYENPGMWDRRLQGSLELYTTRDNETHSFLNEMVNPVATLCFVGTDWSDSTAASPPMVSYEFRTIARLMHYDDPGLSDYERDLVTYINFAHDFFHGGPDANKLTVHNIGVAYYVVEEFDNSPYGMTETAGGQKRVPAG
jgi:hypothetical protein